VAVSYLFLLICLCDVGKPSLGFSTIAIFPFQAVSSVESPTHNDENRGQPPTPTSLRARLRRVERLRRAKGDHGYSVRFSLLDDAGKMDVQLNANVEDQDRAECGKYEAGGMKSSGYRARKHVCNGTANDRSDDAEHDCPENRYVHVHHRFRDDASD
jgi:hypothetical protein